MAETPEVAPEVVEKGVPTPTFTEPSVASPSVVDTKSLAKEVAELLRPDIEKSVQSTKDKRIAKMEKALEQAGLAELEEMGATIPQEVKTEYRLRQLEAQKSSPVPETSPGRGEPQDSEKVSQAIKELELDVTDPSTVSLLSGNYRNFDHFYAEAAKLKLKQGKQPTPSPAQAPAVQGRVQPEPTDKERDSEYQKGLADIAQKFRGDEKLRKITEWKGRFGKN